jgi:hypothetical protein
MTAGRFLASISLFVLMAANASAQGWDPVDPNQYDTKVNFSVAWARRLHSFGRLEDVQRAAKAQGKITDRQLSDADPSVSYHFRGNDGTHLAYMLVTVGKSGFVGVSIFTDDNMDIVLNNRGVFNCEPIGGHYTDLGDHCP